MGTVVGRPNPSMMDLEEGLMVVMGMDRMEEGAAGRTSPTTVSVHGPSSQVLEEKNLMMVMVEVEGAECW